MFLICTERRECPSVGNDDSGNHFIHVLDMRHRKIGIVIYIKWRLLGHKLFRAMYIPMMVHKNANPAIN